VDVARVNQEIPDDLHRDLRIIAAERGITLKAVVEEALRAAVEQHEKRRR
jgi:plasmid stability protein